MKKIKLLTPLLGATAIIGSIAPLASCAKEDNTVKLTLAPESSSGIKVKESKLALNTDSTITLEVPNTKGIKVTYILVGTTRLEASAYSVEDNVITIKADAMKEKNVELCVYAQDVVGLQAKVSTTFEALQTFKASDLTVNAVYEDKSLSKPLTWNTDYLIYDSADKEITDFDTVGYTFTRDEARTGSVLFTIEFVHNDSITTDLNVKVNKLMEPESIAVNVDEVVFLNDTIYPKDIIVQGNMTDGTTKTLEYGTDYLIYDKDTGDQIDLTDGYKFDTEDTRKWTFKSVLNPEEAIQDINFGVQPIEYKNTVFFFNDDTVDATIDLSSLSGTFKYSTEKGVWNDYSSGTLTIQAGNWFAVEGQLTQGFGGISISTSSKTPNVKVYGNALGLLDNGKGESEVKNLGGLFYDNTTITYVSRNFLPSKTLTDFCYEDMFNGCTSLKSAPDLPADVAVFGCYSGMFARCSSLVKAPDLPAKTLGQQCYYNMFNECKSLVNPPQLSFETAAETCCQYMFAYCKNLKTAPDLKAEVVYNHSYQYMFGGCTSLINPPEIKAKILDDACFASMFYGCTSLTSSPNLHAEKLTGNCYYQMFKGCTSLTSISEISATSLAAWSCANMFDGCTKLKINNDGSSGTLIFTCPDTTGIENPVGSMFENTGGTFKGTPEKDGTYYCY